MSMNEQLEQTKSGFIAKVPALAQENIFRHIQEQQQSGIVYGLNEGDQAPDFTLANPLGEQINLYNELANGPVILIFYRGGWCPFCNVQLRAYQQLLPEIQKIGGQLIAVSPQSPDNSLSQMEKEQLTFHVLSDPNGRVADSYNLLFELPAYLQNTFTDILGRDLAKFNASDRWLLPVPATYLIDRQGILRYASVDPDFMNRAEPQEMIDLLKKLD
ncbi:peroxiredoxin-like family protein [Paenibacillus chondroitinus]|uniref:thioredoxin-dependent peroxiredoxin n=1 Tax=Paenibacillus chondroitinus TaxID=59842 RepID=A0ABU6D546_9BACL|nr:MULTISPECIES: peroxiredoxin-like family protein [Paenibacillus]MCY9658852.1 AhpC/TSA family protein [Paenibacillus anseongense]MEB4792850.1 peroxiredoxin-like family protein [Paenibacillus chondroitinus]